MLKHTYLAGAAFLIAVPSSIWARPLPGSVCPTVERLEGLGSSWDLPRAGVQERAACDSNPRPSYDNEKTYTDDEYQFMIHYTLSNSDDRVVSESDVERTAQVMRDVMDMELSGGLGWNRPPDDSADADIYCDTDNGGAPDGGNGYYDIYFVAEDNLYGYCQPMTLVDGSQEASSFLALSTWILDYNGALEVTVAHEYFHGVQFVYDVYEDSYWMENTSTWMEDETYDDINDYYNYLSATFQDPELSLETKDLVQYANAIWPLFMSEQQDHDTVKAIWEECAANRGKNALEAQKEILDDVYDGGFSQALLDFRGAMYNREDFSEGDNYPSVSATELYRIARGEPKSETRSIEHTGAHVLVFETGDDGATIDICYEGANDKVLVKAYSRDGTERTELELDGTASEGNIQVAGLGTAVDQVALVVTYAEMSGKGNFNYTATLDGDCKVDPEAPTGGDDGDDTPTGGGNSTPPDPNSGSICSVAQNGSTLSGLSWLFLTAGAICLRRRR